MVSAARVAGVRSFIESREHAPRIVHTTISGHPTLKMSQSGLREFSQVVGGMKRPVWVSDSRNLTGYERASLKYGRHWFDEFTKRGGKYVIVISDWSIAMMAGRAMALGFGVRLDFEPTLEQALARAEQIVIDGR